MLILFQKHLWCKKGKVKKVQVTEQLKGVKSLWGQEEKICDRILENHPYGRAWNN